MVHGLCNYNLGTRVRLTLETVVVFVIVKVIYSICESLLTIMSKSSITSFK